MDVLVNNFDTPLCAGTYPDFTKTESESARVAMPLAIALPIATWIAAAITGPAHSAAFDVLFLTAHASSLFLAFFCLARALVYGQRKLVVSATATMAAAAVPIAFWFATTPL
jgi:hypothetical protein